MYDGIALHRLFVVAAIGVGVTSALNVWANAVPPLADLLYLSDVLKADAAASLYAAAGPEVLSSMALLVTGVLFLLWQGRARRHLMDFDARPKYSPGWTVGAWLIPLGNIVMPALVMRDIAQWSTNDEATRRRLSRLIWLWWACYVGPYVGTFAAPIARRQIFSLDVDGQRTALILINGGTVALRMLFVAAGVLLILLMRAMGRAQTARAAETTTEPDPADFPAFTMDEVRPA